MRAAGHAALAGGQKAFGRYLLYPDGDPAALVARHAGVMNALLDNLAPWTDTDLDARSMPHPVLGTLSVREALHFTRYHNLHHLRGVQDALNKDAPTTGGNG